MNTNYDLLSRLLLLIFIFSFSHVMVNKKISCLASILTLSTGALYFLLPILYPIWFGLK